MPQTQSITTYEFSELSDRAKDVARNWYREGQLDYNWWEHTYEDAETIGLKITGFDIDRGYRVEGTFTHDAAYTARMILEHHGEGCDTYGLAVAYIAESAVVSVIGSDELDEKADEFLRGLHLAYWRILRNESEYLTSDECVDDSIQANDYTFTADGRRFRY